MRLRDNLVTLMVSTGQIIARGDLRRDIQSLIAPPIRINPRAANQPRKQNNSAHTSSDRLRGSLRSGDTPASLRLCVKNKTTTK